MKQNFKQLPAELRAGFFIPQHGKVPVGNWREFLKPFDLAAKEKKPWEMLGRWVNPDDGFVFVDIDGVRNPETGAVEKWAEDILESLDTYTEISLSGKGFKAVLRGTLPADWKKDHPNPERPGHTVCEPVEIYSGHSNKLMTLTGNRYEKYVLQNVEPRQGEIAKLLADCRAGKYAAAQLRKDQPQHWRDAFHTGAEMDSTPGKVFIKGFLEEGVTSIGSLSGVGKTWIGLSIAHALLSGEPLFGKFPVVNRAPVLYLVPEMGGRKFRERMVKMRISMDGGFFCQTIRDGACDLKDPLLLQSIADMKPVVILDTAIRFQQGEENSSTDQAQGLGAAIFNLISHGAQAVICMHHRKKTVAEEDLTLENALRGSGDFGAMSDCVWAVEHARKRTKEKGGKWDTEYTEESKQLTRLFLSCVKPRDMEPVDPFIIQGRPYIDKQGDFAVLDFETESEPSSAIKSSGEKVLEILKENPNAGMREIMRKTGYGHDRVERITTENGYKRVEGVWKREGEPFELGF